MCLWGKVWMSPHVDALSPGNPGAFQIQRLFYSRDLGRGRAAALEAGNPDAVHGFVVDCCCEDFGVDAFLFEHREHSFSG